MRPFLWLLLISTICRAQPKTIHVFVALCDNENQGIVPVPAHLGDGSKPATNLYWGAMYGVKSFLKRKDSNWQLLKTETDTTAILERLLFKHKQYDAYLLAEAYNGMYIENTTVDFLESCSGDHPISINFNGEKLNFGGCSNLLAYVGHDGLMDFDIEGNFEPKDNTLREAIILACYSNDFFEKYLKETGASPLLWTTHLMAPEAYTLDAAINSWLSGNRPEDVHKNAAAAYSKYQKCNLSFSERLLKTGW